MAPARRLRSLFARLLRSLADAVQPPEGMPVAEPLPAAAAGNEHWFALVQERAPELLTGGGIRAGVTSPDRSAALSPQRQAFALKAPHRSTARTDIYAKHQDGSRRRLPATKFATVRALRRKFRPDRHHPPKAAVHDTPQSASPETVSIGSRTASRPEFGDPMASSRPPVAAGFDAPRPRVAMAEAGEVYRAPGDRGPRREPVPRLATIWPVTPAPSGAAPEFDQNEHRAHAALDEWPTLGFPSKTLGLQPDSALRAARAPESPVWPEEVREDGRWPELPDDEILRQPPASVFDSDNLRRLDDEQRGC